MPHPPEARRLLGVLTLAIAWWVTEVIPLPATALVAAALAIVTGVAPARQVLAPFADPVIFLFLGSFLLAEAHEPLSPRRAAGLASPEPSALREHRRRAHGRVRHGLRRDLHRRSNTATAALMTPIALGALWGSASPMPPTRAESGVLLMIAYGASIGEFGW